MRVNGNWVIDVDEYRQRDALSELEDEYRLAYVALTRAMDGLDPGLLLDQAGKERADAARAEHPAGGLFPLSATG